MDICNGECASESMRKFHMTKKVFDSSVANPIKNNGLTGGSGRTRVQAGGDRERGVEDNNKGGKPIQKKVHLLVNAFFKCSSDELFGESAARLLRRKSEIKSIPENEKDHNRGQ